MTRKLFIYAFCIMTVVSCGRPNRVYNQREAEENKEAQQLKLKIDEAVMKTYMDADYHVEVSYPDFFVVCDTTEDGTARFYYPSEKEQRIAIKMFIEPNIEGWNIHEAIKHLSDSKNVCQEEGEDYFIMSGQFSDNPLALLFEKCYLINGMWIDHTVYYLAKDKDAIGRLIDMVKEWNPRPSMKNKSKDVVDMDSTVVPVTTFGVEFASDPRVGFKNDSIKMPKIKGLYTSKRWAYCKKDSCNSGYYIVGIRCPQNRPIRQWVNKRLWDQLKSDGYDKKASKGLVNNTEIPIRKIADFYLNQWYRHYDHYLNNFLKCVRPGSAFPTEQFGLVITDVWQNERYYTMCVHDWYDMMSCGCPYTTSFHTINATTGKEISTDGAISI